MRHSLPQNYGLAEVKPVTTVENDGSICLLISLFSSQLVAAFYIVGMLLTISMR